jgi:hypothetical protein
MSEEDKAGEPGDHLNYGDIGHGSTYMSTHTNPPHSGDPILEPKTTLRLRQLPEHELLARLAEDLREGTSDTAKPEEQSAPTSDPEAEPTISAPIAPEPGWSERAPGLSPYELDRLEREITAEQRRTRRPLAPEFLPPPPARLRLRKRSKDSFAGLVVRLVAVAVIASLLALLLIGRLSLPAAVRDSAVEPLKHVVALVMGRGDPAAPVVPAVETPKLLVEGADAGRGDEIGLGVKLKGSAEGGLVFVSGLAAGTTLTTGRPWGDTGWIINAADADKTMIRPPRGFTGVMQYTLTLRLADGRSADHQTLRLQWDQVANNPSQVASNPNSSRETNTPRQLAPEELATLLRRGEELLRTGDLAGARLLLRRAAEAHDPVGALALATTYDPNVLAELGVRGVAGDPAAARSWYEKAKEYGSREAPRRLELLASQGR